LLAWIAATMACMHARTQSISMLRANGTRKEMHWVLQRSQRLLLRCWG
jgi:hypothetical protein